jgi:hypothetical protein
MRVSIVMFFFFSVILLSGCVASKNYQVDQNLLNQQVFKSSQEPSFSMKLSDDFEYLGQIDNSKSNTDHSYRHVSYHFVNEKKSFATAVHMITLDTGEWNVYRPWKLDLGEEIHGEKRFFCGANMFYLVLNEKEKNIYASSSFSDGTLVTNKVWVYTPGAYRGTRIIVHYIEKGNKLARISDFSKKANQNIVFGIGNNPFKPEEGMSVADELMKLKDLKDQGILTLEEYNNQKDKLLNQ